MAKRKRGTSKKGIVHRVKSTLGDSVTNMVSPVKVHIVVKNLILFGILFLVSIIIASISSNVIVDQLFYILAILTAFVAVALLIILLTFWFMRAMKK